MGTLNIPQTEWVREYLAEHFAGQPLPGRAMALDTIVIDVTDSRGRPKELRILREFLCNYSKATIREYLENAKIAEQIETVPTSVTISKM